MIKCFLIDPMAKTILPIEWDETIKSMNRLLGTGCVDFARINEQGDRIAVDDTGLVDGKEHGRFTVAGYGNVLAGPGLLFGVDRYGENRNATVTLGWLQENVTFLGAMRSGDSADVVMHGENHTEFVPRPGIPVAD
jgi:hypothetical protein